MLTRIIPIILIPDWSQTNAPLIPAQMRGLSLYGSAVPKMACYNFLN